MSAVDEKELQKARLWKALDSNNLQTVILAARELFPGECIGYNLAGEQTIPDYIEELKDRIRDYCKEKKSEEVYGKMK